MTTLTIHIPDGEVSILSQLMSITKNAGLIVSVDKDDDHLSESEFKSLQNACEEVVLIKKGLSKAIPISELWND